MPMRLAFLGTPDFSVPVLAALLAAGHEVACVYSQQARPKGRGLDVEPSPVAQFAAAKGLMVRTPATLKAPEAQSQFAALGLDGAVVVAYGLLLPGPILDAPRLGCFNLHGSLLPRWRGAAPIQRAIMAGDAMTGVMVMHMDEGLDTGPVLLTARTEIGRKDFGALHDELSAMGAKLMCDAMALLETGAAAETPQVDTGATYAKKITKEETRIDWRKPAAEIDCLIRALSPFPGAWCEAKGRRLKIVKAEPAPGSGEPGMVLDDGLIIACGSGALKLVRLQREGKGAMAAQAFLHGFALVTGDRLD
jgi:methionyl-tRNA formyltransferase